MLNLRKHLIKISISMLAVITCLTMVGCKITQTYADKINKAYQERTPYTYNDVMLKLGDTFDKEIDGTPSIATGNASWYEGYGSSDSERSRFIKDNTSGKKIKAICVEFKNGYAVKAEYFVVNDNDETK